MSYRRENGQEWIQIAEINSAQSYNTVLGHRKTLDLYILLIRLKVNV